MRNVRILKLLATGVVLNITAFSGTALAGYDFQSQDPKHQLEIGYAYFSGTHGLPNNRMEAAKWFRKAAAQGNLRAMNILGILHVNGLGVPQDTLEAARLFRKTAELGDSSGMFLLGAAYITGDGVPQNLSEGARWIRKAADMGNTYAMEKLGSLYYTGQGVQQDRTLAAMWYRKSAQQGKDTQLASLKLVGF